MSIMKILKFKDDMLPTEHPIREALMIYAKQLGIFLISIVIGLIFLVIIVTTSRPIWAGLIVIASLLSLLVWLGNRTKTDEDEYVLDRKRGHIAEYWGKGHTPSTQDDLGIPQAQENQGLNLPSKVRVLVLAANPQDADRLALDEEMRAIQRGIRASNYRDSLELISSLAVRPGDLLEALNRHQPHIVQFSGHGYPSGEITLLDSQGTKQPIDKNIIGILFETLADNIRVVILNKSYSKVQAEKIAETVDCVIGINEALEDYAVLTFLTSFYKAIGFGRSVQDAFEQGKIALLLEGISEENYPELLTRDGIDSVQLKSVAVQEKRAMSRESKVAAVELTLALDFDQYTLEQQKILLQAITELMKIDDVRITKAYTGK